jgi:thiol-disulfide isomerase/thioredoxin
MDPILLRGLLVAGGIAVVAVVGLLLRRRDGRLRLVAPSAPSAADQGTVAEGAPVTDAAPRLTQDHLAAIGLDLEGAGAGAVLLGSPTCSPCEAVKRVLAEVEADREGFRWVYADAGEHLDLARDLRVLRVPTLLVVDAAGRVLARSGGVPSAADVHRVLGRPVVRDDVADDPAQDVAVALGAELEDDEGAAA